jgi:hypothetical protein
MNLNVVKILGRAADPTNHNSLELNKVKQVTGTGAVKAA